MTDKTPEGRKSDTMPLNMRERAEELEMKLNFGLPIIPSQVIENRKFLIEQALIQAEKEGFERGVKEAAQAIEDICYSHDERINAQHQELLEDDGAQQAKLQVLGLLPPREKSRIEREGK